MTHYSEKLLLITGFIGSISGIIFGGFDGFLYTLCGFMIIDYLTGVLTAIHLRRLSSATGFHGLLKKMIILMLVAMGHLLDQNLLVTGEPLRTAIIFFYITNEGISILENIGNLGIPIPQKIKKVLTQLSEHERK
ncbi:MAG: phage holin family protein [Eubacteriaceae bacterium]